MVLLRHHTSIDTIIIKNKDREFNTRVFQKPRQNLLVEKKGQIYEDQKQRIVLQRIATYHICSKNQVILIVHIMRM